MNRSIVSHLIAFSFFLLLFISFFGTTLPFQDRSYEQLFEQESSNIVNQIIFVFLFFSSIVSLIYRHESFFLFIQKEKLLIAFILLCVLSAFWSEYPFISFKRSFQLFVTYLVIILAILNIDHSVLLKLIRLTISAYLFFSLFSCIFIPAAIDPIFGTWRGIEVQKNGLAQNSFFGLLSSLVLFKNGKLGWTKYYDAILITLSIFLIFMARSSSVFMALFFIIILFVVFKLESLFQILKVGRFLLGFTTASFAAMVFIFINFSSTIFAIIPEFFNKDLTLSGRVPIWVYVWSQIEKHLIVGYGYGTYWIMGSPRIDLFASYFEGFKVNEAHNGYLEILLQVGIVGLVLFLGIIVVSIYRTLKIKSNIALVIILSIYFLNLTESLIFQTRALTTFFYFSTYLATAYYYFEDKKRLYYKNNEY